MVNKTLAEHCNELQESQNYKLTDPGWLIIHLNGRKFRNYLRSINITEPFNLTVTKAMKNTALKLVKEVSGCVFSFVYEDSIILLCHSEVTWYGGSLWKLSSVPASIATGTFGKEMIKRRLSEIEDCDMDTVNNIISGRSPQFDCKAWKVPTLEEAYSWLVYNSNQCAKSSLLNYTKRKEELSGKNKEEVREILKNKTPDWKIDVLEVFRHGLFITQKEDYNWIANYGYPLCGQEGRNKLMPYLKQY